MNTPEPLVVPASIKPLADRLLEAWDKGDLTAGHALIDLAEEHQQPGLIAPMANSRNAKPTDTPKHMGMVFISLELLANLLHLPTGTRVEAVSEYVRFMTRELALRVEHPDLPIVGEAQVIPRVDVLYRTLDQGHGPYITSSTWSLP